jgi:ribonucleoside-diphosphate reductase alpha chain
VNYHLRKQVYNDYRPFPLLQLVQQNVSAGFYDANLLLAYTEEEWNTLDSYINHGRDENFTYVAMEQWRGKYLVQNRVTGTIYETPQMAYMLISATLFQNYPKETRLQWVQDYYDAVSVGDISLPTPVMAGVRTPQKQFSSCVLIETDDSLDSINATTSSVVKYVSQKAGIGLGVGRIRALNSPIRNGDAYHTGVIPFYKLFQAAVKSCSQGGVRSGAATLYYPIWHLEVEDLLVLKNNKGTEDNRVRHVDYGVQFNKLMYERLISGGDITLFSPNDVPEMYEAFFNDQERFRELYERAERNTKLRKKTLKAIDLFSRFMQERKDTGRVYLQNVDHANTHSPFKEKIAPVKMSNLCCLTGDSQVTIYNGKETFKVTIENLLEMRSFGSLMNDVKIKSWDGSKIVWKNILDVWPTKETDELIEIETQDGKTLRCTPDHKILTQRGWVEAQDLREDDNLVTTSSTL